MPNTVRTDNDDWIDGISVPSFAERFAGASPAQAAGGDDWVTGVAKSPEAPGGSTFMQRLNNVWDNPTPGGLVSIVKGIYNGLEGGASLTRDTLQGNVDPTSDEGVTRAYDAAKDMMALSPATAGATQFVTAPVLKAASPAVEAATRLGLNLPRYAASDGSFLPRIAQGAKLVPWAGEPVENAAKDMRSALSTALNQTATAPATTRNAAGNIAGVGIEQGIKDAQGEVGNAYDAVNAALDNPGARVPLTNTAATMQQIMNERKNANLPEWSPAMQTLAAAATDPAGMNYQGIKTMRSYLAESHPQQLIAEGLNPTEVKRLYGPLTQDLTTAVHAGGGDKALQAWQFANWRAREAAGDRERLYKIIGSNGNQAPEAVFGTLARMASDSASGNIDTLQKALQTMGPQARGAVGDAVIARLGRDVSGNFSPARFVTDYQKVAPQARDALFTPQQKARLDDVLTVSQKVKDNLDKFENTSKTAHSLQAVHLLTAINPLHWPALAAELGAGRAVANYASAPARLTNMVHLNRQPMARGLLTAYERDAVGGLLSP
jgi:hypothetical protein